jgi:hypothetical protein
MPNHLIRFSGRLAGLCRTLWTILFSAVVLAHSAAFMLAQTRGEDEALTPITAQETLPLTVDGAETPERIPDELAYRHFILAIALPDSPSPEQRERRDVVLGRIGLSEEDYNAVLEALAGVRNDLDIIDEEITTLRPRSPHARFEGLRVQRESILDYARNRMHERLSAEGSLALQDHIRDFVKRQIRIYGEIGASGAPPNIHPH